MGIKLSANLADSRYDLALRSIARFGLAAPANVVFDVGAGDGRMREPVQRLGCSWHGFDLAPAHDGIGSWNLGLPCPVSAPRPDVVLLLDVIEHLANPGLALANIAQVLRPRGRLVMTMPNPRWSRSRIHALLTGFPTCFTPLDLEGNGHVFPPWPHVMMSMLAEAGFEVEDYVTLDGTRAWPSGPVTIRYPLRVLHALACMLIERLDPTACGMSYGLVARKC